MSNDRTKRRKMKIIEARKVLEDEEAAKLVNEEELKHIAVQNAEASVLRQGNGYRCCLH